MPAPCKAGEVLRAAWLDAVHHRVQTDLNICERKADEIEPQLSERTAKKKVRPLPRGGLSYLLPSVSAHPGRP